MRVFVSRCMRFCVFPRGPMIKPMKLYPGNSFSGTKILRFFFVGRQSCGGRNKCGHRATSHPARSLRSSRSFCSILCSRVFTRAPRASYRGGGEGDRSRSGRSSRKSRASNRWFASRYLAYCRTTSGSSESAGVGPPSAAPTPCARPRCAGARDEGCTPNLPTMPARRASTAEASGTAVPVPVPAPSPAALSQRLLRLRGRPSRSSFGAGAERYARTASSARVGPNVKGRLGFGSVSSSPGPGAAASLGPAPDAVASAMSLATRRLTSASAAFTDAWRSRMRSTCHARVSDPLPTVADSITPTSCCAASEMPGRSARPSSGAAPSGVAYPPVVARSIARTRSRSLRRVERNARACVAVWPREIAPREGSPVECVASNCLLPAQRRSESQLRVRGRFSNRRVPTIFFKPRAPISSAVPLPRHTRRRTRFVAPTLPRVPRAR